LIMVGNKVKKRAFGWGVRKEPIVFLDTNILWYDYLLYVASQSKIVSRWYYDISFCVTFTKCIYEVWGLGKALVRREIRDNDEKHRKTKVYLENLLIEKYPNLHVGNRVLAKSDAFSLYEATEYGWTDDPYSLPPLSRPRSWPPLSKKVLKSLLQFDQTYCKFRNDFYDFMKLHKIREYSYLEIFGKKLPPYITDYLRFDGLLEHLQIPAEDLEIALAAIFLEATYFITEDTKLFNNWRSIGLNVHYPQPILCEEKNRQYSLSDIITKWCYSGYNKESAWIDKLLSYAKAHPDEFIDFE
jgi:hypothetical protein